MTDPLEARFWSGGCRLAGTLQVPGAASPPPAPWPVVVQGPGWLGLRSAKLYRPYHEALLGAGIAVFTLDYRGFGDSEGDATYLDPRFQVEDIRAAIDYLSSRPDDVDVERLGVFGSGGTGGGNAVLVAAEDERVRAIVSQVPVADGRDWLHRMRPEHEWLSFLEQLRDDRHQRAVRGEGALVSPREGIMVPTPERRATNVKSDVDGRVPAQVALASAEAIMAYRPIDAVSRIAPRAAMFICVEGDAVTPEDHALALYERAGAPKRLVIQRQTSHYAAYARYGSAVTPMIVDWFQRYLAGGPIEVREAAPTDDVRFLDAP